MGEPLYAYQAPTGYPDRADAWVNTGALLNRMNFGLQFASQRIPGIDMDLPSLHDGVEPESRQAALHTYAALLLPGRDLTAAIRLLTPMVSDPGVVHRVAEAAPKESAEAMQARAADDDMAAGGAAKAAGPGGAVGIAGAARAAAGPAGGAGPAANRPAVQPAAGDWRQQQGQVARPQPPRQPTAIEQVVGVVLGSPEFQRR